MSIGVQSAASAAGSKHADRRRPAYEELARRRGADAWLLTSPEAVQHATGVHIYAQELIPERPVAAVIAGGATTLVCWQWEHHQIQQDAPGLALVGFPEFGQDPWDVVADTVTRNAGRRPHVLVEWTSPWAAVRALERANAAVELDEGFDGALSLRMRKDADEVRLLRDASRAADAAIAAEAPHVTPERTERDVAGVILAGFAAEAPELVQGSGICVGVDRNLANHHLASERPVGAGPTRLGLEARVGGYWMIILRMGWPASTPPDSDFDDDYARYIDAWTAGMERLRPGVTAGEVYATVRDRLAALGITIRSPKVGHGTGLTFREPPILRADDPTPLEPGMVFAYDFAIRPETYPVGSLRSCRGSGARHRRRSGPSVGRDGHPSAIPAGVGAHRQPATLKESQAP